MDDSTHAEGESRSIPFSVLSKSSIYEALLCTSSDVPASSLANSAVKLMLDGAEQLSMGRRSRNVVSHWLWRFHDRLNPQMRLFRGSAPMSTFDVSGFSVSDITVPPNFRYSE